MIGKNKSPDIGKGTQFSKDNQPSPAAKSAGKVRVTYIKTAMEFIGQQIYCSQKDEDGNIIEFSREAAIVNKLYEKAEKGDLKAIQILIDIGGWKATAKVEVSTNKQKKEIIICGQKFEY